MERRRQICPWDWFYNNHIGQRLVTLLDETIANALPSVRLEIINKLVKVKKELADTGVAIDTTLTRRIYYSEIVDQYFSAMQDALNGDYVDELYSSDENCLACGSQPT
jgi:hypothetical protein